MFVFDDWGNCKCISSNRRDVGELCMREREREREREGEREREESAKREIDKWQELWVEQVKDGNCGFSPLLALSFPLSLFPSRAQRRGDL